MLLFFLCAHPALCGLQELIQCCGVPLPSGGLQRTKNLVSHGLFWILRAGHNGIRLDRWL